MRLIICSFILLTFMALAAQAQDKIYKKDGSVISAKIKSVEHAVIVYKRFDFQDGPDYTILKREVSRIVYENGIIDQLKQGKTGAGGSRKTGEKTSLEKQGYGDNILTFIPAALTGEILYTSINDPGIGICYERMLDAKGHISFCMPVMMNFVQNKDFTGEYYNNYNNNLGNINADGYRSYMLMPGVKFYPADKRRAFRYAIGLSFFVLFGNEPYAAYDNTGNHPNVLPQGDWHYTMYGASVLNSFNVSVSKHFYMEFDANGLATFADNRLADKSVGDYLGLPMMQFVLKAGYRF